MPFVKGPHNEQYDDFYRSWRETLKQLLEKLRRALVSRSSDLASLVEEVSKHYQSYYKAKISADKQDVVQMMNPSWRTPLEAAMLWIGGWRPSMTFRLLHSLTGQESSGSEALEGFASPTMNPLSQQQLERIGKLSVEARKDEESLSYRLAELQQSVGDQAVSTVGEALEADSLERTMSGVVEEKVKRLEELVVEADGVRIRSLCGLLDVLDEVQAAQYLVGAGQLQAVISKVGEIGST